MAVERDLVQLAQLAGFVVRNREHASGVVGASVLDELVTEVEQKQWLGDPVGVNAADTSELIELDPRQLAAHRDEFDRLPDYSRSREIIDALRCYAVTCIPYPKRTEATFWTVSCLPKASVRLRVDGELPSYSHGGCVLQPGRDASPTVRPQEFTLPPVSPSRSHRRHDRLSTN
ncbi:hypothetical protein [Nocardia sp. NPDC051570]|uniref:hypothetical protein n=1 Tax=Nocardia sp. NPDC051570 TaxID=3364324 RepID=UPI0037A7D314